MVGPVSARSPKPTQLPPETTTSTPSSATSSSARPSTAGTPDHGKKGNEGTKPRTIHEWYDQHTFQWREFNPEDTVVGDGTDPFIVYMRYASKSIGARRTPWILPKNVQLIKIMQDCLPDFDWRTGEDLLVCYRLGQRH